MSAHREAQIATIHKLMAQVMLDPEIADHCDLTSANYAWYRYEWSDQIFADFLSSRDSSANYFPVEWKEYQDHDLQSKL